MTQLTTERISDGYKLTFSEPIDTPELSFDGEKWIINQEWMRATDSMRVKVITLLYNSRASLFKNSPSQKTLENLLTPWVIIDDSGDMKFNCELPKPNCEKDGKGKIVVNGLTIRQSGITPNWLITSFSENTPVVEFNWSEESEPEQLPSIETELREITLIESEVPFEETSDTLRLNTDDEYNARKFAAKERVKEARLKAILARRAAEVETNRYYNDFSTGDNESSFSEYDISDYEEDESEEEGISEA
jgi:hypothetical protein